MTVTGIDKNPETFTLTITSEWAAPIDRVWQLWADPRKLERWWGPPTHPATVVDHDLRPEGKVSYFMTGPDGDQYHGWWKVVAVDEPNRLELVDGFANDDGTPNDDMPTTRSIVTFDDLAGGTTGMVIQSVFPSREAMEQMLEMGMEEGLVGAMGQIDEILGTR